MSIEGEDFFARFVGVESAGFDSLVGFVLVHLCLSVDCMEVYQIEKGKIRIYDPIGKPENEF
jgi:hypothetical protein